jgi:phenylalanyl-tRNA synthetase alpha subunit
MKRSSVLLWLGINLAAAATICYVVLAVHYHPKQTPTRIQPAADTSYSHIRDGQHQRVNLREKLTSHKHRIISQLRQSLLQQKVSSKHFTLNQARFFGTKKLKDLSPSMLLENLQNSLEKSHFHPITPQTNVFPKEKHLLKNNQAFQKRYKSCAIVSSAGALLHSELGSFIGEKIYNIITFWTKD